MSTADKINLATSFVFVLLLLVGCSTNKTGSQWSLANINPFKKSQAAPYPQKPSAFATPSAVPGDKQNESLAGTSSREGMLYPSTSPQVYSGSPTSRTGIGTSNVGQQSFATRKSAPQNAPTYEPMSRYDPNAFQRGQNQAVQAQPAGNALASDRFAEPMSEQNVTASPPGAELSRGTIAGSGVPFQRSPAEGVPVSYNAPPSPENGLVASGTSGSALTSGSSWNVPPNLGRNPSPTTGAPGASSPDWGQLVGDRYAQMYRQSPTGATGMTGPVASTPSAQSTFPPATSGYVPGNTGYIPGQTPNPPGNVSYQPGNTGYQPPGVPPYTPPYATQIPSSVASPDSSGNIQSPGTMTGEYRPGSTKTYIPRTGSSTVPTTNSGIGPMQ